MESHGVTVKSEDTEDSQDPKMKDNIKEAEDEECSSCESEELEEAGSSSYESDEEAEPKLDYERLMSDVPKILMTDAASCLAVHPKFIALGTHLGVIHILDHQGNNIRGKELLLHATTVNQISIDEKGDYIASCSNDCKVVIHGFYLSDMNTSVAVDRPARAIALDPNFSKSGKHRRFIVGEDRVVLYEHYVLSRYKSTILYLGEGPIRNIQWRGNFVAWASDKTVRVYDISVNKIITVIKKDHDPNLRTELYRCNLFWKDNRTLLIGWADSVKVCSVKVIQNQPPSFTTKDHTVPCNSYVEITSMFNPDFYVCGISSLGDAVVALGITKPTESVIKDALRPQLHVLEPHSEDFTTISCDFLSLHGYQEYKCNDYHLGSLAEESLYYIMSSKDFVIAKPINEDSRVEWLLKHGQFKKAMKAAKESKNLEKYSVLGVGQLYLDHLLKQEKFDKAAQLCSIIFASNKQLWENEVYKFAQIRQLRFVAPYLPLDNPLGQAIYEMVLNAFLQNDPKGFLGLIKQWPSDVYDIQTVINVVQEHLSLNPVPELSESLCELYILAKQYDRALNGLIEMKSKDRVFELIKNNNLFGIIHDKLEKLMELNPPVFTNMLVDITEKVPIDLVINKLKKRNLLYEYLSKMFQRDPTTCEDHHGLLVELYAEYAPEQLLSFLRSSNNNYPLEHALDICKQRCLFQEVVFLLGRMGNTKQALEQITQQLNDIDQAIEFCKEHDDKELWEYLIQYSVSKPSFITVLLQNIGTYVDPIMLIREIPEGLKIPGLRDSLVKILQDYNLQMSLREGCKKILVSDFVSLLEKLHRQQNRSILINEDQVCQACHSKLLANDIRSARDILVFNCRHAFHEDCLPVQGMETCSICSAQKRRPGSSHLVT